MQGSTKVSELKYVVRLLIVFAPLWALAACDQRNEYVAPPAPKVTVAKPLQQAVIDYPNTNGCSVRLELSGFCGGN